MPPASPSLVAVAFVALTLAGAGVWGQQIGLIMSASNAAVSQAILFKINFDTTVSSENVLSRQAAPLGNSIVQLSTGALYLCGLKSDGEIVCESSFGFSPPYGLRFTQVVVSPPTEVDRSFYPRCVCGLVRGTGAVACWGVCGPIVPTPDPALYRFSKISLGATFGCGIMIPVNASATAIGGPLYCWGMPNYYTTMPVLPDDQPPVIDLSCYGAGVGQCCAITAAGSIVCYNSRPNYPYGPIPQLPTGNRFVSINLGFSIACAMDSNSFVSCFRVLDTYTYNGGATPPLVPGAFSQFTLMEFPTNNYGVSIVRVCGIQTNGLIWCSGNTSPSSLQLKSIAVGDLMACALTLSGSPLCFGDPSLAGNLNPPVSLYADAKGNQLAFANIYVGSDHNCGIVPGLTSNTSIVCWNTTSQWVVPLSGNFSAVVADCAIEWPSNYIRCWAPEIVPPPQPTRCSMLAGSAEMMCCLRVVDYYSSDPQRIANQVMCFDRRPGANGQWFYPNAGGFPLNANITLISVFRHSLYVTVDLDYNPVQSYGLNGYWYSVAGFIQNFGASYQQFAVCNDGAAQGAPATICYLQDNTTSCVGTLDTIGMPCQLAGSISSISCGQSTACVVQATTATPYCWSTTPATTPIGYNPWAAQMPTQEPVSGLPPRGRYQSSRTGDFQPCPAGTFSAGPGATNPLCSGQCPAGTYSAADPATNTTTLLCDQQCPKGQYCVQGTPAPVSCPAGVFGSSAGLTSAACTLPCPIGYYCPPGSTSPTANPCPPGTYGSAPQLGSLSDCKACEAGKFSSTAASVGCITCSMGSYTLYQGMTTCSFCSGILGVNCQDGHPNNTDGYWTYIDESTQAVKSVACPPGLCLEGLKCGKGRMDYKSNPMCGECMPGYSSFGNLCIPCTEANGGYIILFLLLSFFWVFIMYHLSQTKGGGDIKIALYFVATSQFMLGPNFAYWLGWMGILNYNPFKAATGVCVLPLDPYTNLALDIMVPLGFLVELIFFGFCHYLFQFVYTYFFREVPTRFVFRTEAYVTASMSLLIGSYSTIADVCMSYINCVPVRGQLVMWASPSIDCASAYYKLVLIPIAVLLAVLIAGLPFVILPYLWYRNRDGQTPGVIEKAVADFTFRTYHKRFQWWESFAILRRSVLVALSAGLFRYPVQRSQAFCILNFVAYLIHAYCKPFRNEHENQMESVSLLLLSLLSVLLIGQETDLTTVNAVLATLIVAVPVILFLLWKTRTEALQRFGPPSQWSLAAILNSKGDYFARSESVRRDVHRTTTTATTGSGGGGGGGGGGSYQKNSTLIASDDTDGGDSADDSTPIAFDSKVDAIDSPQSDSGSGGIKGGYVPPVLPSPGILSAVSSPGRGSQSPADAVRIGLTASQSSDAGDATGRRQSTISLPAAAGGGDEKSGPEPIMMTPTPIPASHVPAATPAAVVAGNANSESTPLISIQK